MSSIVKEVEEIELSIRSVLEDEGLYSPVYDVAIRNLAQAIFLKDAAFKDAVSYKFPDIDDVNINSAGSSIIIEQSREGFLRYKNHPSYILFLDYTDKVMKLLDSMTMTAKSSIGVQEDEIDEFKKKVEESAKIDKQNVAQQEESNI